MRTAESRAPLLQVKDLSYAVRGKTILSRVSFHMLPGDIRAVIGPNGAGKSTLAKCLAGVVGKTGGEVAIAGQALESYSRRELARKICYLPQFSGALPEFGVREYVLMGRYAHGDFWRGPGPEDGELADRALGLAGIAHLAERRLPTLSGGERQLAAIAAGLAQEADLLLLDEPASFLDPGHTDLLISLILRLNRERGISFLVVTHDLNLALLFTGRTLALREGRAVFDRPSGELTGEGVLAGVFGMDFSLLEAEGKRLVFSSGMLHDFA